LPVVLCTHIYRSRIYRDEAVAAGAQRYVLLPVKLDELVGMIAELTAAKAR
jgi:CheY-like chemotaxis protein